MNFDDLYQELILDHSRRPRNYGEIKEDAIHVHGDNPSCGDEIHLHVRFGPDKVEEIAFTGHGCAISQASASMMTLKLKGKSTGEAQHLLGLFHDRVSAASELAGDDLGPRELGDLNVLGGVRKFPQRVKCAMLAWRAFEQALAEKDAAAGGNAPKARVSTEKETE
ncbi:MAG TPA: SUF system NifU family Fe-S cluster assembly protein [Chthoniobacteraceae bacterium]|nr:SUF system NifU family Fe-S cluster assembly protein [Chthoniobacteraceae bacterium]